MSIFEERYKQQLIDALTKADIEFGDSHEMTVQLLWTHGIPHVTVHTFTPQNAEEEFQEVDRQLLEVEAEYHGLTAKYMGDNIRFTIAGEFWYIQLYVERKEFVNRHYRRMIKEISRIIFLIDKYFRNYTSMNDTYEFTRDCLNIRDNKGEVKGLQFKMCKVAHSPTLIISNAVVTEQHTNPSVGDIKAAMKSALQYTTLYAKKEDNPPW